MRFRILILLIFPCVLFGQSPERFSFQAVVYDNENKVVSNKNVRVRISILTGSINGAIEYQEVHSVTTNNNGLFSLEIGNGTPSQGTFGNIQWGSAPHFLKREIDPTGGTNYLISGISQLLSVPYSIHSNTANKLNITPGLPGQILAIDENGIPKWTGDAYPSVTTVSTSSITATTAIISVNITSSGGQNVSSRGVVYNTSDNPTFANSSKLSGSGTGSFTLTITDLSPNTTYFVRGFATNSVGTGYGTSLSFNTTAPTIPILSTNSITSITQTSAISGGVISSNGGSDITARGVVWSTSSNPTISNSKTTDGAGTGNFSSSLSGLSDNTTYYVRAYATNGVGTSYGNEISFTTSALTIPILTTTDIVNVTNVSASSGGTISSDGGSSISAKGVVWSTSSNPTISDNKTIDGTGTASYNSTLTGLSANTTYYVRAYATNSSGTGYGNQRSFTTASTANTLATVILDSVGSIGTITAIAYGNVTNEGGGAVTERGFVWNSSGSPTVNSNRIFQNSGLGNFNIQIESNLSNNSKYYIRAYVVNNFGFIYSNELEFTTAIGFASVTTNPVNTFFESATSGGNIIDNGGSNIIARGVVWNTSPNPTISNNKTLNGNGNGSFTSSIIGLTPSTTYYLRAYATNNFGTAYGNELTFNTTATPTTVTDIDGNVYNTVEIGTQVWMAENLKVSRFNNGISIPYIIEGIRWAETINPAWCYYANNPDLNEQYGRIYNGYAIISENEICPIGWKIPSSIDFEILINYLGGSSVAGGKLKIFGSTGATNSSGFSAKLGGIRYVYGPEEGGRFEAFGFYGFIWKKNLSSLEYWTWNESVGGRGLRNIDGAYIRCIKDQ